MHEAKSTSQPPKQEGLQPCNASDKAEAIRAEIGSRSPELLQVLDDCKRVFGARLLAIDCGPVQRGDARNHNFGHRLKRVTTVEEELAAWKAECEAQQARAGAYKGSGYKRATKRG